MMRVGILVSFQILEEIISMILALGLSYMASVILNYVFSISSLLQVFIISECSILSNLFSASIEMIV